MEEEKVKLKLYPKDYLVLNGGLKIENMSDDVTIEIEVPKIIKTIYELPDEFYKINNLLKKIK